jgi:hypothetical protein
MIIIFPRKCNKNPSAECFNAKCEQAHGRISTQHGAKVQYLCEYDLEWADLFDPPIVHQNLSPIQQS